MNVPNLKPCPFCGGEPTLSSDWIPYIPDDKHTYRIHCDNPECHIRYEVVGHSLVELVKAWNHRYYEQQENKVKDSGQETIKPKEIRRCPFCGNTPEKFCTTTDWVIHCFGCDAEMKDVNEEDLIDRWNTRFDDEPDDVSIEAGEAGWHPGTLK